MPILFLVNDGGGRILSATAVVFVFVEFVAVK
jgi:hypothetical protein